MDATHESSVRLAVFSCSSSTILVCRQSTPTRVTICSRSLNNATLDDQQLLPVSSPWTNGMASLETPPTRTPSWTALFITPTASSSPARACAKNVNQYPARKPRDRPFLFPQPSSRPDSESMPLCSCPSRTSRCAVGPCGPILDRHCAQRLEDLAVGTREWSCAAEQGNDPSS